MSKFDLLEKRQKKLLNDEVNKWKTKKLREKTHPICQHQSVITVILQKFQRMQSFLYSEWEQLFSKNYPAMTIGYITELGLPEIKIEIEIWAAKV